MIENPRALVELMAKVSGKGDKNKDRPAPYIRTAPYNHNILREPPQKGKNNMTGGEANKGKTNTTSVEAKKGCCTMCELYTMVDAIGIEVFA